VAVAIANTQTETRVDLTPLQATIDRWHIRAWLMVPVIYQGRLLGMVELHQCMVGSHDWSEAERSLIEAVAAQLGVALIQAESFANLEDLN